MSDKLLNLDVLYFIQFCLITSEENVKLDLKFVFLKLTYRFTQFDTC